mgnify:CR=1 FL=1
MARSVNDTTNSLIRAEFVLQGEVVKEANYAPNTTVAQVIADFLPAIQGKGIRTYNLVDDNGDEINEDDDNTEISEFGSLTFSAKTEAGSA